MRKSPIVVTALILAAVGVISHYLENSAQEPAPIAQEISVEETTEERVLNDITDPNLQDPQLNSQAATAPEWDVTGAQGLVDDAAIENDDNPNLERRKPEAIAAALLGTNLPGEELDFNAYERQLEMQDTLDAFINAVMADSLRMRPEHADKVAEILLYIFSNDVGESALETARRLYSFYPKMLEDALLDTESELAEEFMNAMDGNTDYVPSR